jgi:hypothetical protein
MDKEQSGILEAIGGGSTWEVDGKRIPRMTFYKPDGETLELLADPYHLKRYLARGFTLKPPSTPETDGETSLASEGRPASKRKVKKRRSKKQIKRG